MNGISDKNEARLRVLSKDAAVAAGILHAASIGLVAAFVPLRTICEAARIPQARASAVQRVLHQCEQLGLFQGSAELNWRFCGSFQDAAQLALLLEGIALFQREVHVDRDTVSVVLTEPSKPSKLAERLEASLMGTLGIVPTTRRFFEMAASAKERLVVMTPFIDEAGAPFVSSLFEKSRAQVKQLVIRGEADGRIPDALKPVAPALLAAGVKVYDYRLERSEGAGRETFHAKVVLADNTCYVGSFNMTQWSLGHSLELGLAATGASALRIADVLSAIADVSERVALS